MKISALLLFTLPFVYAASLSPRLDGEPACFTACVAAAPTTCGPEDINCLCRDPAVIDSLALCIPNTCNGLDARAAAAFGTEYCQSVGEPLDPGIGLASKTTAATVTTTATETSSVDLAAASSATSLVMSALSSASGVVQSVDQSISMVIASATSAANSAKSSAASAAKSVVASATSAALSSPSVNVATAPLEAAPGAGLLAGVMAILLAL